MTRPEPGWDAKTIARIAKDQYGSFKAMFEAQGGPERGANMMTAVPRGSWLSGADPAIRGEAKDQLICWGCRAGGKASR
jgi:hypothetical protein